MADEQFALSPSVTPPPTEADYEAIFTAVMETMRGRWFLAEYAKRNRHADTDAILAALTRVEAAVRNSPPAAAPASPAERVRINLVEMAKAIAHTRAEIASIKPEGDHKGSLSEATEELDSIVQTTERATSDILAAAEQVQEIAWTLREHGTDGDSCDALDRRAADIYTACSFQDLTGQRTRKVVDVLQFLEARINSMIEVWGEAVPAADAPVNGAVAPQIHEAGAEHLDQPHIDEMMPRAGAAEPAAGDAPEPVAPAVESAATCATESVEPETRAAAPVAPEPERSEADRVQTDIAPERTEPAHLQTAHPTPEHSEPEHPEPEHAEPEHAEPEHPEPEHLEAQALEEDLETVAAAPEHPEPERPVAMPSEALAADVAEPALMAATAPEDAPAEPPAPPVIVPAVAAVGATGTPWSTTCAC